MTPGAWTAVIAPTTTGWLQCLPQSVDLTALIDDAPVLRSNALYATWIVPSGATAMSAPWLFGDPPGPPVEIVRGCENVSPPSLEVLKAIGAPPLSPWKFVWGHVDVARARAVLVVVDLHPLLVRQRPCEPERARDGEADGAAVDHGRVRVGEVRRVGGRCSACSCRRASRRVFVLCDVHECVHRSVCRVEHAVEGDSRRVEVPVGVEPTTGSPDAANPLSGDATLAAEVSEGKPGIIVLNHVAPASSETYSPNQTSFVTGTIR